MNRHDWFSIELIQHMRFTGVGTTGFALNRARIIACFLAGWHTQGILHAKHEGRQLCSPGEVHFVSNPGGLRLIRILGRAPIGRVCLARGKASAWGTSRPRLGLMFGQLLLSSACWVLGQRPASERRRSRIPDALTFPLQLVHLAVILGACRGWGDTRRVKTLAAARSCGWSTSDGGEPPSSTPRQLLRPCNCLSRRRLPPALAQAACL